MSELEEQLRQHASWLDASHEDADPVGIRERAVSSREGTGVSGGTEGEHMLAPSRPASSSAMSRSRALAVAAAVLVVSVVAAALIVGRRTGDEVRTVEQPVVMTWSSLPTFEHDGQAEGSHVIPVWTGNELVLVGALVESGDGTGGDPVAKIATLGDLPAVNPASGAWRSIAPPPVHLSASDAMAVWTGSRLLVLGATPTSSGPAAHAVGASYDPTTATWAPISPAPNGRGLGGTGAWAGDRFLTWSLGAGVTAYDPATDSWEILTTEHLASGVNPPPAPGEAPRMNSSGASSAWTGTELIVTDQGGSGVAAFDPATRLWRSLPPRPSSSGTGPVVWTGNRIGIGDVRGPAWIEPTGAAWHSTPGLASFASRVPSAQVWLPDRFLAWGGTSMSGTTPRGSAPLESPTDGVILALPSGTWSTFSGIPAGSPAFSGAAVAGDQILTWGLGGAPSQGHVTIRAATVSTRVLAQSASSGTTVPEDAPLVPPPGITQGQLNERGHYGFSTTDPTWQFGPYRRDDHTAPALTEDQAVAAARRAVPTFVGNSPEHGGLLGHLLETDGNALKTDTLAWMLTFSGVPGPSEIEGTICVPSRESCQPAPGTTTGSLRVVVDARSGEVLLIQHISPGQG